MKEYQPLARVEDGSADPDAVADWSHHLSDSYIRCRDMGHTWRPYSARVVEEGNAYERTLRCGRCRTERSQTIGLSRMILQGRYVYPSGYPTPKGSGRITGPGRGALRLESTLRLLGERA
jgi:hypothetical protein